jgi:hypothetical protein
MISISADVPISPQKTIGATSGAETATLPEHMSLPPVFVQFVLPNLVTKNICYLNQKSIDSYFVNFLIHNKNIF